jgi:hypothetical protein
LGGTLKIESNAGQGVKLDFMVCLAKLRPT